MSDSAVLNGRARTLVTAGAAAYVAAHLPYLARSLEDIDSINFALGLQRFDVSAHQPHPPGYPLYIALGRLVHVVARAAHPGEPFHETAAIALAVVSACAAGLAVWALSTIFVALEDTRDDRSPHTWPWAVALASSSPLFWVSGLRPMSDVVGLAFALVSMAGLFRPMSSSRAQLVWAAAVAGLAAGVRVQTALLTVPPLALMVWRRRSTGRDLAPAISALIVGALSWAVPLAWISGGVGPYLRALGSQAGEDFSWVAMLWADPTPRRLARALTESFVYPWSVPWLAAIVLTLALAGAVSALRRERATVQFLAVAFGPYAVFHLLLQETSHVRYALPLVVPVAWFAARSLSSLGVFRAGFAGLVVAVSLWQSIGTSVAYARQPHPAFRAIDAMTAGVPTPGGPTRVFSHFALYRALQVDPSASLVVVPPVRNREWMGPVAYWRNGGQDDLWFLADPRRMDLELFDPRAVRPGQAYPWDVSGRAELGGARPVGAAAHRLSRPRWMVGPGWSLSPEAGGRVREEGTGLDRHAIEAFVRRGAEPLVIVVGGLFLGAPDDPSTALTIELDGAQLDQWTFDRKDGPTFLRVLRLPDGVRPGDGPYATLRISARSTTGGPSGELAIRQFDVAPAQGSLLAFGRGWHEDEYEPSTGRRWRWSSDQSELFVVATNGTTLLVRGESPLRYFDEPPRVRISVGDRVLSELRPDADFEWRVTIPPGALPVEGGTVTLALDRAYLPGPAEGTADARRLGLRTFSVRLAP